MGRSGIHGGGLFARAPIGIGITGSSIGDGTVGSPGGKRDHRVRGIQAIGTEQRVCVFEKDEVSLLGCSV